MPEIVEWDRIVYYQRIPDRLLVLSDGSPLVVELEGEEIDSFKRAAEALARDGRYCAGGVEVDGASLEVFRRIADGTGIELVREVDECWRFPEDSMRYDGITIEVTTFCPFRCPHCLIPVRRRESRVDIDPSVAAEVTKRVMRLGAFSLSITGGEPSLYPTPGLRKIIREARRAGGDVMIMMNTNGYGIDWELASLLADEGVFVKLSVYGVDRESYARYTGVPDAYDRLMRAVENLRRAGAKIWVDFIYTRVHEGMGISPDDALEFARSISEEARVTGSILSGWGARRELTELTVVVPKESRGRQLVSFHPRVRYLPSFTDPCAITHAAGPFVTADGWVYTCPFDDELIAHVLNQDWLRIYYVKVVLGRQLPWFGGRCAAKGAMLGGGGSADEVS